VLLLDEPLGGVDPGSIAEVIKLLRQIRGDGMTLVVIEHNLEALTGIADRLIAMTLGQKIADGAPAEVMRDERLVRAYLGDDDAAA
jgi:branched-chain amino acid transport system ATP-binding protein